jgi:hypothetical protein
MLPTKMKALVFKLGQDWVLNGQNNETVSSGAKLTRIKAERPSSNILSHCATILDSIIVERDELSS